MTEREFDRVKESLKGLSQEDRQFVAGYLQADSGLTNRELAEYHQKLADLAAEMADKEQEAYTEYDKLNRNDSSNTEA